MRGTEGATPGHALPPALLLRPRRRENILFTVLVSVALFLGACVMALVLLAADAPGAIVVGAVLASLPVGPLVACYLWLDRYEPEPIGLLGLAFGWGAVVATAAALVLQSVDQYFAGTSEDWSATIVAPLTEELTKGLFVVLLLWFRRHELDGILDGLVYAGLVGIGFAFTENILYLASAYVGGDEFGQGGIEGAAGLFIVRGIFSPFAHPLFTSCIGIGVGLAVITRRPWVRFVAPLVGYASAVALHATWNASAFFQGGQLFFLTYLVAMVPAFLVLVGFAAWARSQEAALLTRALTDAAHRGYVGHGEVPWLVRLPARRSARRHARILGGEAGERMMREYQQEAIELAFLHNRYLRGVAPRDAEPRGSAMVERLAMLRPYVQFPQPTPGAYPRSGS
ncbi:MAG TPA: PrsW family intramembrane metalloprotease [Nocardioidaceae bacterium]|nr:PrsW family intramembrane metalloprotease [Nocardioidaceae bacterium]